jgi:8-oxo-dGTP pyrophosphatase MutT (NUDIX family)
VSLPGGKRDEEDASDVACALREAQEEVGLQPAQADVLCLLPPLLSKHLLSVSPVVAIVPPSFCPDLNADEVSEVRARTLGLVRGSAVGVPSVRTTS